jgi:3-mercaptopyruvate sulfurtransferase SseA
MNLQTLFRHWRLACVCGLLALAHAFALASPLVTPAWLDAQVKNKAVVVLDASMPQQFAAGRIPGAVSAPVFGTIAFEQPVAVVQRRFQALGLNPGQKIVVYDEGGSWMAARLFHDLHYHGVPLSDLHLLDGGLHAWKAAGLPTDKGASIPVIATGTLRVTATQPSMRAQLIDVFNASAGGPTQSLVDALEAEYYFGAMSMFDRPGHIPNAKNWPVSDFFDPATKTFKPRAEIERMAAHLGVNADQAVVVYCGGGGAAAVPNFALRYVLGRSEVKLYNESLREWLSDSRQLPVMSYAEPQRLRSASSVAGWNTPLLRFSGMSQMTIVDLRAPEAFAAGHVPFSINVPAEAFRANLEQPQALAQRLSEAGLSINQNAVLVSDAGLTPNTALAMLMLERAGQRSVSLMPESFDDWSFAGLTVAKPQAAAQRPPASYPVRGEQDRISLPMSQLAARAAQAQPVAFLSVGKQAMQPQGIAAGQIIHLPYTDLLDAKGTPKPAKELWSAFNKAKLPRYAEIVIMANDFGEAAVAYQVLKMMGYANVRVAVAD